MKTNLILVAVLAAALGADAMWISQHRTQTIPTYGVKAPLYYTCPMHPSVKSAKPGNCPECGMKLVPVYKEPSNSSATNASAAMDCCGVSCEMNSKP